MLEITFDTPVLKVKGLETKFDTVPVSASLEILLDNRDLAQIVQQLHYWTLKGYGEVIDGVRWFYKSIDEWIREVFPTFTQWKLGKMMKQLADRRIIRREKLFTKHQIQNGDRFWWQPKNQTYYYSLDYKKLQELAENFTSPFDKGGREESNSTNNREFVPERSETKNTSTKAETAENSVSIKTQILSNKEIEDTKDFDCAKNNTKNTSIENNSRDLSLPHLPCECKGKKDSNQDSQELSNRLLDNPEEIDSVDFSNPEPDTNNERVEQKINQNKNTNKSRTHIETEQLQKTERPSPKLKATSTKQKRDFKGPWQDEAEKSQFYRALIQALPIVANSHSPQGLAKTIIAQLKRGEEHTYWDDFKAGLPIGSSTKPEWEIEPGVPYPMFIEYLTEKIIRGNNTQTPEQARNEVFRILDKPRQAKAFWGQFKRSVVNVSEQVSRDHALGVSNPNTPVWTRERIEPTVEEAAMAGKTIMAVNSDDLTAIESVKTRCGQVLSQLENAECARRQALEATSREPSGKDSAVVSTPPNCPNAHTSTSSDKSIEVSPSSDPWKNDEVDVLDEPQPKPSMREMLAQRGVKGFCKPMPKVSRAEAEAEAKAESEAKQRQQMNHKTHLSQMSVDEINELVKDPIFRAQLTPQLIDSNYELITDYLGQIIGIKLSELQIREKRSQSMGE